jgi:hypothetical protein
MFRLMRYIVLNDTKLSLMVYFVARKERKSDSVKRGGIRPDIIEQGSFRNVLYEA